MNKIFYFILSILVSGCANAPNYSISPDWNKSKLAKIHVYRTNLSFHSLNPEKPFFYLDGKKIGKLGTGQTISIDVLPGKHTITAKEPLMFMPSYESGKIEIVAEENKVYYVRYSKDFSGIIVSGNNVNATGKTSIQLANEEYYLQRK